MNSKTKSGLKIIANNRKAKFNYFLNEFFEAGIVLRGSEVKSLREGRVNISESFSRNDVVVKIISAIFVSMGVLGIAFF